MNEGDLALACASLLVDELVRGGVEHACVSPGSRSTPLALALSRHGGVRVHVVLDERSAGFVALGAAKASGRPAAVACTSGTAAANLLPAVVEASYGRVPLVVLTADRPPELRDVGANQTIDQLRIYGAFTSWAVEAGVPEPGSGRYWRSLGARAAAAAAGPPSGPVHVNLAFREPLVPAGGRVDLGDDGASERFVTADRRVPLDAGVPLDAERGLIVAAGAGLEPRFVGALADATGWPVLAEAASGARVEPHALAAGQWLLQAGFAEANRASVVLQLGRPVTSRASQALLESADTVVVVDDGNHQTNPGRRPAVLVRADPSSVAQALAARMARGPSDWTAVWREADARARAAGDAVLESQDEPTEPRVARDLASSLPGDATLVVASSMPVRDLDAAMAPRDGLRVLTNRGASGIDGFVSTVLGVSAVAGRAHALAGDLSMIHDAGGLLWAAARGYDAVFVVMNNRGGGVFDMIAQATIPEHDALFVTPHDLPFEAIAAAAGARYERVERASALAETVARHAHGVTLVEVPIDRRRAVETRSAITAAVGEALA